MGKYLILIALLFPTTLKSLKVDDIYVSSPVYKQIIRIKPNIDLNYAADLTKSIYGVARAFKIDPRKLTAIIAQESSFNIKAINHKTKDYGLAQINHKTAKAYNFDLNRLTTDIDYSVRAAGKVLFDFKKTYGKKEKRYWSRYNSSNPEKRKIYEELVVRFL